MKATQAMFSAETRVSPITDGDLPGDDGSIGSPALGVGPSAAGEGGSAWSDMRLLTHRFKDQIMSLVDLLS